MPVGIAVLAISVQLQITIDIGTTAARVSLSDIVAVLLLPIAVSSAVSRWSELRAGLGMSLPVLFGLATAVMAYGFLIGVERLGALQAWPIVKFVGWFALVLYAFLGLVCGQSLTRRSVVLCGASYVGAMVAILVAQIGIFIISGGWWGEHGYRFAGFLGNPNAQGFALLCGLVICLAGARGFQKRFGNFGTDTLTAFVLAGILQTGSLATFIATGAVSVLFFVVRRPRFVSLIVVAALTVVFFTAPQIGRAGFAGTFERNGLSDIRDKIVSFQRSAEAAPGMRQDSLLVRAESYRQAVDQWLDAPIFGNGLGFHLHGRNIASSDTQAPQLIHNTGLWILSEMGAVGLTVFVVLFGSLLQRFLAAFRMTRNDNSYYSDVFLSVLLVMIGWLVMSQAHEMLYQRTLWLMLGIALGASAGVAANRHAFVKKSATP